MSANGSKGARSQNRTEMPLFKRPNRRLAASLLARVVSSPSGAFGAGQDEKGRQAEICAHLDIGLA
jgi:hypothetical protein